MKALILNILISYILSLSTTNRELFYLPLYGSKEYNGNYASFSILNISNYQDEKIYISYYINSSSFNTEKLSYGFTDDLPDENFYCPNIIKSSHSSRNTTGTKKSLELISVTLYFEIKKQNKAYLVLDNLLFQDHYIVVSHNKDMPKEDPKDNTVGIILAIIAILILVGCIIFYVYLKIKQRTNSKSIDFKKEEPSSLYPPQANDTPMQQPPYEPQPIPPEAINSNETGTGVQGY